MTDCPFCHKLTTLDHLPPGEVVWSFPHSVALLGTHQFYRGYCVLISRQHARELSGLADEVRRAYLDEMCLLARAIECPFRPHKLNYELLGNQVPHLHWHLFPRYPDDPDVLNPVWLALERGKTNPDLRRQLEQESAERPALSSALHHELVRLKAPTA
jgi:diadenosine tetraphosphate (Ap4A) HIT family hydrolase